MFLFLLGGLRLSDLTVAGGDESQGELNGVLAMLSGIKDGQGPSSQQSAKYSPFFKLCLKRAEYYVEASKAAPATAKKGALAFAKVQTVPTFGLEALEIHAGRLASVMKKGDRVDLADLQIFRAFDWLLDDKLRKTTQTWIQDFLKYKMQSPSKALLDKSGSSQAPAEDDDTHAEASSTSASSGGMVVPFSVGSLSVIKEKTGKATKKATAPGVDVMAFFGGR